MLFQLGIEVVDCDAESIEVDVVGLDQDDGFVAPHVVPVDCLV